MNAAAAASLLLVTCLGVVACGADKRSTTTPNPPDNDAGNPEAPSTPDHGQISDTYPAFPLDVPQIIDEGGSRITNATIVSVTWPGDPNAAALERFGDAIGQTKYWHEILSEYGIQAAKSGETNHVRMETPLAVALTDTQLNDLVTANTTRRTYNGVEPDKSLWPAPTNDTIYLLFLPPGTSLTTAGIGDLCAKGVIGYHTTTPTNQVFVAIPSCNIDLARIDNSTAAASHELAEAVLDPFLVDNPAYRRLDDKYLAWTLLQHGQTESGDMCTSYPDALYRDDKADPDFNFLVQRQWSNSGIRGGHAPCVPHETSYFNVTHLNPEMVQADTHRQGAPKVVNAAGVHIALGQKSVLEVGFYSDAPTNDWTIIPREFFPYGPASANDSTSPHLVIDVDKSRGRNGEKAYVSVEVTAIGPRGNELLLIESTDGTSFSYLPILIVSN